MRLKDNVLIELAYVKFEIDKTMSLKLKDIIVKDFKISAN